MLFSIITPTSNSEKFLNQLIKSVKNQKCRDFEHIFIDIGDDQSIESDLSTYSSHLKSAKHIVNFCNNKTLTSYDARKFHISFQSHILDRLIYPLGVEILHQSR